jgi:hypothetical protein
VTADTDARVPKNDPHVQQLQRWLSDANAELASLRKRLSEQVGSPVKFFGVSNEPSRAPLSCSVSWDQASLKGVRPPLSGLCLWHDRSARGARRSSRPRSRRRGCRPATASCGGGWTSCSAMLSVRRPLPGSQRLGYRRSWPRPSHSCSRSRSSPPRARSTGATPSTGTLRRSHAWSGRRADFRQILSISDQFSLVAVDTTHLLWRQHALLHEAELAGRHGPIPAKLWDMLQCDTLQVNRLDKDNDGLRAENNRLATLLAERQPLVDRLHATVDALQEVAPPKKPLWLGAQPHMGALQKLHVSRPPADADQTHKGHAGAVVEAQCCRDAGGLEAANVYAQQAATL